MDKPWHAAMANCSILGNPEGAGLIKSIAPGWICPHCCWTNLDKLVPREANNSRDRSLEKRKIYFGCQQPGEVAGRNNQSLHPQDGHLEFYKERFRRVRAREQAGSTWSWVRVSMCSARDRGQGRTHVGCSLLGIPLLSGHFWSGSLDVLGYSKTASSMPQSTINKHMSFN